MGGVVGDIASGIGGVVGDIVDPVGSLISGVTGIPQASTIGTIGSILGNTGSANAGNATSTALAQQDPLGQYRSYFADQLMGLYQDPSSVTQQPGYQFQLQQGTDAVQRSAAAKGNFASGNTLAGIQQYGQGLASQYYQQDLSNLASLSSGNPAYAQLGIGGQLAGAQQTQSMYGNIAGLLGNLFSGGSTGSSALGSLAIPQLASGGFLGGGSSFLDSLLGAGGIGGGVPQWRSLGCRAWRRRCNSVARLSRACRTVTENTDAIAT